MQSIVQILYLDIRVPNSSMKDTSRQFTTRLKDETCKQQITGSKIALVSINI